MAKHDLSDRLRTMMPFAFWPYLRWGTYGAIGDDGASAGTGVGTSLEIVQRSEQIGIGIERSPYPEPPMLAPLTRTMHNPLGMATMPSLACMAK